MFAPFVLAADRDALLTSMAKNASALRVALPASPDVSTRQALVDLQREDVDIVGMVIAHDCVAVRERVQSCLRDARVGGAGDVDAILQACARTAAGGDACVALRGEEAL